MPKSAKFLAATMLAAAVCLTIGSACAQTAPAAAPAIDFDAPPPIRPAIQGGANSLTAHQQLLTKAKLGAGKIDVYVEGDSIARRWGPSDPNNKYLANWKQNFFGWNAADFGWGADTVQNILWRLENGELDGLTPKVIVFLGGTNNVQPGGNDRNVNDITGEIRACIGVMRKKVPDATIIITGIFPRNDNMGDITTINRINANLEKFADGKKIRYININDKLADNNGKLLAGMMNTDHLHPDTKGYQVWADALKPIITEILGPPAKEDHAPPPTGDPKVAPNYPPKTTGQ